MTRESIHQRANRGVIIATCETPHKVDEDTFVIHGWFTDGDTCACPDFEFTGGPCKHVFAATIWQAHEAVAA